MWRGVRYWHFYWQNGNVWYYYTGTWKFTSQWNNFIPPAPLPVTLPEVCHLLSRYYNSYKIISGTGALLTELEMYDFCISLYKVVQVNEMMLSLIFSTSHFSWSPSLTGNTPAFLQKMSINWCFYTSVLVRDLMLPAASHSFWSLSLTGNTTTCLQKMFMNWCLHPGALLKEMILFATSHSSWSPSLADNTPASL
jgi:hypothetical protein